MWKVVNEEKFPIKVELMSEIDGIRSNRNATDGSIKSKARQHKCSRLWNKAPDSNKISKNLLQLKNK